MATGNGDGHAAAQRLVAEAVTAYARRPYPVALCCGVQPYGWGDTHFIPDLLQRPTSSETPQAELWIGAHPDLPATACVQPAPAPLDQLIAAAPARILGAETARRFGATLPFLLKVLAAARPLSIQAHPTRADATRGFAREEQLGVGQQDPKRSYRDRNHKPELLVALTDFHALRGFRPLDEIAAELALWPGLAARAGHLDGTAAGVQRLYAAFMRLPQADVDTLLAPVLDGSRGRAADLHDPAQARYRWLLRAHASSSADGHYDRGLLSFLLLNLLHLRPGDAIFLPAGELHSYLDGAGLEVMANSNNVLRGGLTDKHIDVEALLEVLRVRPHSPEILRPLTCSDDPRWLAYTPPAAEVALHRLRLEPQGSARLEPTAVMLGLSLHGELHITGVDQRLPLRRGGACLLPAGGSLHITAGDQGGDLVLATTPGWMPAT